MSYFDSTAGQTPEDVARYYRAAHIGAPAAFIQTHYDLLDVVTSEVKYLDLDADRVTLRSPPRFGGPTFFISSGRNCHSPIGKSQLIIPTPAMIAKRERERLAQEEEARRFAEFWRQQEELMRKQQAEAVEVRMHRQLPGRWIKAQCLEPECGHQAVREVASLRFALGLTADAVISKLYCSRCGSTRVDASWSETP